MVLLSRVLLAVLDVAFGVGAAATGGWPTRAAADVGDVERR
jgi:hypothetical protein